MSVFEPIAAVTVSDLQKKRCGVSGGIHGKSFLPMPCAFCPN